MLLKTAKLADSYRVRWELFSDLVDFDMNDICVEAKSLQKCSQLNLLTQTLLMLSRYNVHRLRLLC